MTIEDEIARAFYGDEPGDMATGPSDLIPLITTNGAVFCEGSNHEGHGAGSYIMCRTCGAQLTIDFTGSVLPHWRWTTAHLVHAAEARR